MFAVTCTGDTLIVCVDIVISGESARFCNTDGKLVFTINPGHLS